jgi:hypothetical protein
MQELHINIQDQLENFSLECSEETAFTLRVYLYETLNGVETPFALSADNTASFCYYVNSFSTEFTEVEGIVLAGIAYVDFPFTTILTDTTGTYASCVNIMDAEGTPESYASGKIHFNSNPSTRS